MIDTPHIFVVVHPLFTFGHGTAHRSQLVELLSAARIAELVDVRTAPGSRRNPDVTREEMARWLPEKGIEYRWERRLGGWRKSPPDSPDIGLRNRSFAGYAAHMRTREFLDAIRDLLVTVPDRPTTVLCSESLWWRCHRRMIADFVVLSAQMPVLHLMHDGQVQEHRPTDVARIRDDGLLVYDGDQWPRSAVPLF
ncbi:MAG: hypothetical protein QOG46_1333 [Pseudonocardiales bacterium]|nr:hypothetical protein [Pseudonocardiales bacterium]